MTVDPSLIIYGHECSRLTIIHCHTYRILGKYNMSMGGEGGGLKADAGCDDLGG